MEMKWISIAVAALAAVVLGYIWNSLIFKDMGQEPNEHRLPNPFFMPLAYILNFLIAYGLYGNIIGLHAAFNSVSEHPFFHGAFHGMEKSFLFGVVSVLIITALLNGKGIKWILVSVSYWITAMALMGGIIGVMG